MRWTKDRLLALRVKATREISLMSSTKDSDRRAQDWCLLGEGVSKEVRGSLVKRELNSRYIEIWCEGRVASWWR